LTAFFIGDPNFELHSENLSNKTIRMPDPNHGWV